MAPRRKSGTRTRHGSRKLILNVFRSEGASRALSTTTIFKRVADLSNKSIPDYSVRTALRTLVRRKVLRERRDGREKSYTLLPKGGQVVAEPTRSSPSRAPAPVLEVVEAAVAPPETTREPAVALPSLPHKLLVGEALVLSVDEQFVETVTNVHGKLVVERHPRTSRS